MADSSGSSPDVPPPPSGAPAGTAPPGDTASYPAPWTRRILVGMALAGVGVIVAAVLVLGGGDANHKASSASRGQVGSAEAGSAASGSPRTSTSVVASSSTTTVAGETTTTSSTEPHTATTTHGSSSPSTAASTPTTVAGANFYVRGNDGPCPANFTSNGSASSSTQAFAVANCLVHAWAWQQTTTKNGLLGMDALADPAVIPTLLNLGHFLNHLHATSGGCAVDGSQATCTFTDLSTDVQLQLQQGAAYSYGWVVSTVSWDAASTDGSSTTTRPSVPPPTGPAPASTPASTPG